MYLRFESLPANLKRRALGVIITVIMVALIAICFNNPKAHAQSSITVNKVLERNKSFGAASIVTNGDTYLYNGELGDTFISQDGLHWAKSVISVQIEGEKDPFIVNGSPLIWDGKQFITYQYNLLATSKDGLNWTGKRFKFDHTFAPSYGATVVFRALLFDSKKYIALTQPTFPIEGEGLNSIPQAPYDFYYSYDLKTWQKGTSKWAFNPVANINTPLIDNLASNGKDIYLASGDQRLYSKDGIHWEGNIGRTESEKGIGKRNLSGDNGQQYIWDGKKFWFAFGQEIKSSSDGEKWSVEFKIADSSLHLDTIGYNGRAYLATGPSKAGFAFYYSLDGKSWEKMKGESDSASGIQKVLPIKGGFLVAGSDIYWISDTEWNSPSSWAASEIAKAEENQLVKKDLLRAYNTPITRSEFSKTAVRLYEALTAKEAKLTSNNPFLDTARPDVLKAYALGIVQGQGNGLFKPDEPITRQDLAVMFYRTIQAAEVQLTPTMSWQTAFSDLQDVASYAEEALRTMNEANIINGKDQNRLAPLDKTSREEAMVMAQRIYEKYQMGKIKDPGPDSGFESIKGFLEEKGYVVLREEENSINGDPIVESYVVQNDESKTLLTYNKIDPAHNAHGLYEKIYITDYVAVAEHDVLELSCQIIEKESGVQISWLSEFLNRVANDGLSTGFGKSVNTFMIDENNPDLVVHILAYWGGKNNLIMEINF